MKAPSQYRSRLLLPPLRPLRPLRMAVALALAPLAARAADEATLHVGDPAPALALKKFVKGEPVQGFEKGKMYVVEFWATWCGPCIQSIPHLSELQKAHPDITFIGVDVGEDEAQVRPFVTKMGDKMNYRVALDDLSGGPDGATDKAYMDAAKQPGIPTAFIVDKDLKLAWIGHPGNLASTLEQIAAGTFNPGNAAADKAKLDAVNEKVEAGDFDAASKMIDELIAADPAKANKLALTQITVLSDKKKDLAAAAKKADELCGKVEDGEVLNVMAWILATGNDPTPAILATARKLSEKSLAKDSGDAAVQAGRLDTLARVYAAGRDFPKAVATQTQAVETAKDGALKSKLIPTLDAYKAGEVPVVNHDGTTGPPIVLTPADFPPVEQQAELDISKLDGVVLAALKKKGALPNADGEFHGFVVKAGSMRGIDGMDVSGFVRNEGSPTEDERIAAHAEKGAHSYQVGFLPETLKQIDKQHTAAAKRSGKEEEPAPRETH